MANKTCGKCGTAVEAVEVHEFAGRELCEECYMDALSPTRTCDPWAVHTAKTLRDLPGGHNLTPNQQKLYDLIEENGSVPILEAAAHQGLSEEELKREFAPLRHREKLRACKKDDAIHLTLF